MRRYSKQYFSVLDKKALRSLKYIDRVVSYIAQSSKMDRNQKIVTVFKASYKQTAPLRSLI